MLVIRIKFVTGRYHATPWDRNVNEGVPEWPPSPFRIIRALISTWKLKLPYLKDDKVMPILEQLASECPSFFLPPATISHTEAYLNANEEDRSASNLVFDPFVAVSGDVLVGWINVNLSDEQKALLLRILSTVVYLGRSESLVSMDLCDAPPYNWNCHPSNGGQISEGHRALSVLCPVPPPPPEDHKKWYEGLTITTDYLKNEKTKIRFVPFKRVPYECTDDPFEAPLITGSPRASWTTGLNAVLYAMVSKVLPDIKSTVELSEHVHKKLMGIYKRQTGDPLHISPKFSGKDESGEPLKGHNHVYILPIDSDGDSRLDKLLIKCKGPFDDNELAALNALTSIYQRGGLPDIDLKPIEWGEVGKVKFTEPSTKFASVTPFVSPRHYREGRGPFDEWIKGELRRELLNHGFSQDANIRNLNQLTLRSGKARKWYEFRRSRKGDVEMPGFGFTLEFGSPVSGPIAIGYGAHFGLGLFLSAEPKGDELKG